MKVSTQQTEKRIREFADFCRRHGIKGTHQRTAIFRELAQSLEHPDAKTIYRRVRKRIPEISFDTVYRTLRKLEEKGLISRVGTLGECGRFDANSDRHHHFICTSCGMVRDFYNVELEAVRAPDDIATLGRAESVHVEVRGVCNCCAEKKSRAG